MEQISAEEQEVLITFKKTQDESSFFTDDEPIIVSGAPGRLDVMGGISDYSGGLVLQYPVKELVWAFVQKTEKHKKFRIRRSKPVSAQSSSDLPLEIEFPLEDFFPENKSPLSYEEARRYFDESPSNRWGNIIAGNLLVLQKELKIPQLLKSGGLNVLLISNLPEQKGVASSAAVEVAIMKSLVHILKIEDKITPTDLAFWCQAVENHIVGAPCGIMDQMTSVFGTKDHLLALLCRPANIIGFIPIPDSLCVWGIDSGVKHSHAGEQSNYTKTRIAAAIGKKIIEKKIGKSLEYLASLPLSVFNREYANLLPEKLNGSEFTGVYGNIDLPVLPHIEYHVRNSTLHPIYENFRVGVFKELLNTGTLESFELLGELMFQSHEAYSACGLGTKETDLLVDLVRNQGVSKGLYGARVSGGGSGGTVVVIGKKDAAPSVQHVVHEFEKQTGYRPYVFVGSGSGRIGSLELCLKNFDSVTKLPSIFK